MKAKHGHIETATAKRIRNNKLQAARRKVRRSTDAAWQQAQCKKTAEKRKNTKEEAMLYADESDFDPEPGSESDGDM